MLLDDFTGGQIVEVVCLKPSPTATRTTAACGGGGGVGVEGGKDKKTDGEGKGDDEEGVPSILLEKDVDLLGKVVKVKGCIGEFRGMKQVLLKRMSGCILFFLFLPTHSPTFFFVVLSFHNLIDD